ncbi:hypothetical protein F1880_009143 [Penicillium rolfsii]|nr:hypothetical protein F1880_009143 [Penicillium rolfsii]
MHSQNIFLTLALALPAFVSTATAYTTLGCYSEVPDLKNDTTNAFQSYGQCVNQCSTDNYKIAILSHGDHCSCSNAVPPASAKVSNDKCDTVCPGFPTDYCGGNGTYMVLSTGETAVSGSDDGAATTPAAATAAGGIVVAATTSTPTTTTVPTSVSGTMISKAGVSSAASGSATAPASSASASASPTNNAAVSLRGGSSIAGALVAGLGLLL